MLPTYRKLFWIIALLGLAVDQASKYGVFDWLKDIPGHTQVVIPGVFDLVAGHEADGAPYVNRGALFGWLQKWGADANTGFAVVSMLAALAIICWASLRSTATERMLCISLGLILAGTLGNFYDRVVFGGVRDFLHWKAPEWPVFNFADCCLVVGAGLLLLQAFFAPRVPNAEAAEQQQPGSAKA